MKAIAIYLISFQIFTFSSCRNESKIYSYTLTNECVKDYIKKNYTEHDIAPFIKIIEDQKKCKEYYISGFHRLSVIQNSPPCYYTIINNKLTVIYTDNCLPKDTLARKRFFVNLLRNNLQDDITKKKDRYIDGYKVVAIQDFFDPLHVRISECANTECSLEYVDQMPL